MCKLPWKASAYYSSDRPKVVTAAQLNSYPAHLALAVFYTLDDSPLTLPLASHWRRRRAGATSCQLAGTGMSPRAPRCPAATCSVTWSRPCARWTVSRGTGCTRGRNSLWSQSWTPPDAEGQPLWTPDCYVRVRWHVDMLMVVALGLDNHLKTNLIEFRNVIDN